MQSASDTLVDKKAESSSSKKRDDQIALCVASIMSESLTENALSA